MAAKRVNVITSQIVAGVPEHSEIPEIKVDPKAYMLDTAGYLQPLMKQYPDMFFLKFAGGKKELILSDRVSYEEILGNDDMYGTPGEAENMQISQTIFNMPDETMKKHLHHFADGVKKKFQVEAEPATADIVKKMEAEIATWPADGEVSVDTLGEIVFWAMIETLFGPVASRSASPNLPKEFENVDAGLFKMLRSGKVTPEVRQVIEGVVGHFKQGINDGTATGPVVGLYRDVLKGEANGDDEAARMSVAAWWGGLGNTLPSTMNTLVHILGTPGVKEIAIAAVHGKGEFGSDGGKRYLTACLKDFLRLCLTATAQRTVKVTHNLTTASGKTYQIEKGTDLRIHFVPSHFDPAIYEEPHKFDPSRYLGSTSDGDHAGTKFNGVQYAWAPFSGGRHRCSGYALVMEEVPAALQVLLRSFEMELTEELPPFAFTSRGFGVKFPVKDVNIRFSRRA